MRPNRLTTPAAHSALQIETRQADGDAPAGPGKLGGYAAVFYDGTPETEYRIYQGLVERILPGAFDAALRDEDNVHGLFNHQPEHLLGVRSAGHLRLSVDKKGLQYEIDLPQTTLARDVAELVGRGDVYGSSFGFRVDGGAKRGKAAWIEEVRDGELVEIREIHEVELVDVGPVTRAAYEATTAELRQHLADAPAWGRGEAVALRARQVQVQGYFLGNGLRLPPAAGDA